MSGTSCSSMKPNFWSQSVEWKMHIIHGNCHLVSEWYVVWSVTITAACYLNKGSPTWWHLLYYVNFLLNMFRMLIHPSSGACDYFMRYCVGCIVLTWGVLVLCSGIGCWWCGIWVQAEPLLTCTRIPYHQQPIPLHNTNTPQVSTIQPTQ